VGVRGSRVGVVGGSIGGCAAAIALGRLGCDVTVFERSSGALRDRGSGIAIPVDLRNELIAHGYLPPGYRCWPDDATPDNIRTAGTRRWVIADGTPAGRLLWEQPSGGAAVCNNWSVLWQGLRARIPDASYRDGTNVTAIMQDDTGVEVVVDDGTVERFDVVFGADGYRSLVRSLVNPGSDLRDAGYILWRGNFPEAELSDRRAWDEIVATTSTPVVAFDGGHAVMYPIPDFEGLGDGLRVNWAIYAPRPPELELDGPTSVPPGTVPPEVFIHLERLRAAVIPADLQPLWAGSIDTVSIQPIYDETADRYVDGRLALIGDAATLARPHTGSGATKAMRDARCLEQFGAQHLEWSSLLGAYDAHQAPAGRALVELGRRIGRDQVEQTPPWTNMTADDYVAWAAGSLGGQQLYFYSAADRPED
jgi:2-polyprenyl-6-methoxyphenol hydroxylase-like FAD-dependent oxidoreductase